MTVNYPLLKSNPYHKIAGDQFGNKGGGILTIRAGSRERAYAVINRLKYVKIATNIGDVRTLVIHPASTIYLHSNREAREAAGVFDDSIRVSCRVEDCRGSDPGFHRGYKRSVKKCIYFQIVIDKICQVV